MQPVMLFPLNFAESGADLPLDVSEEECELTENEVDMLMDVLDDDEASSGGSNEVEDLGQIEPIDSRTEVNGEDKDADRTLASSSSDSFRLPDVPEDDDADDASSEQSNEPTSDTATEPASGSNEPLVAPSANIPQDKMRKRVKQDDEPASKSMKLGKKDEWDEARTVSHLLLSPYDASFGLLSRVDTR